MAAEDIILNFDDLLSGKQSQGSTNNNMFSGPHLKADQSVGLMFACAGRGENWYNRAHVESHLFKKYFPSSLITGFFCDGEIGLNCLPDTKTNAQISPEKKTKVRLTHWYTTILVYLGFKKPKKRDQTT